MPPRKRKPLDRAQLAPQIRRAGQSPLAVEVELERLRYALKLIGTKCSTFTSPSTCVGSGRTPDAEYDADRWCDQCIARVALSGESS